MSELLQWTGYPLVDVGAAGIIAFSGQRAIGEVTLDDARQVAEYIERHYPHEPFKSFLTAVFPNSGYVNPTMGDDKRKAFIRTYLRSFESSGESVRAWCTFCGRPAQVTAFREHIPLIMSRGMINFVPNGVSGLPVCGPCLLCVQAVPLSGVRCEGKLLAVCSDDPDLMLAFARRFVGDNREHVQLLGAGGGKGSGRSFARTLLLRQLGEIEKERGYKGDGGTRPASLSVYHLTNYGTRPDIAIYHLPFELVRFLRTAWSERYGRIWRKVVDRAWDDRQSREGGDPSETRERRNWLYEDVFRLPQGAPRFVRTYLLRGHVLRGLAGTGDWRDLSGELELISWDLTAMFLDMVVNMEKSRIEAISVVGARIADYIEQEDDRALFRHLLTGRGYDDLRWRLIREDVTWARSTGEALVTLDEFVEIFEADEDLSRGNWSWRLPRDLLLIRIIERLGPWLRGKQDLAETLAAMDTDVEDEEQTAAVRA